MKLKISDRELEYLVTTGPCLTKTLIKLSFLTFCKKVILK